MTETLAPDDTILGPNAQAFVDHLVTGLELFDLDFNKFEPHYATHEEYGKGILFNQVQIRGKGKYQFKRGEFKELFIISIDEKAIRWPALKEAGSFPIGDKNKENNPQQIALLVLSAMVRKMPIPPPRCEDCRDKEYHRSNFT